MELIHDRESRRFRLPLEGGGEAVIRYAEAAAGTLDLRHTIVPQGHQGEGVGARLVEQTLKHVRGEGMRIVPTCRFVAAYLKRHPEYQDLVA